MEKEKEINQELRDNILKLIHQELDSINRITLFYNLDVNYDTWNPIKSPIHTEDVWIKENVDTFVNERFNLLKYTLIFKDGEPDIIVSTKLKSSNLRYEYYKSERKWYTLWLYAKKLTTAYNDVKPITKITCGPFKFELTSEENEFLFERTKFAYEKQNSLIKEFEEKNVVDKINLRLKK